jgi:hypothetical protein
MKYKKFIACLLAASMLIPPNTYAIYEDELDTLFNSNIRFIEYLSPEDLQFLDGGAVQPTSRTPKELCFEKKHNFNYEFSISGKQLEAFRGKKVILRCNVSANVSNTYRMQIFDGFSSSYSLFHSG